MSRRSIRPTSAIALVDGDPTEDDALGCVGLANKAVFRGNVGIEPGRLCLDSKAREDVVNLRSRDAFHERRPVGIILRLQGRLYVPGDANVVLWVRRGAAAQKLLLIRRARPAPPEELRERVEHPLVHRLAHNGTLPTRGSDRPVGA